MTRTTIRRALLLVAAGITALEPISMAQLPAARDDVELDAALGDRPESSSSGNRGFVTIPGRPLPKVTTT